MLHFADPFGSFVNGHPINSMAKLSECLENLSKTPDPNMHLFAEEELAHLKRAADLMMV